jgi:hypothetical protein
VCALSADVVKSPLFFFLDYILRRKEGGREGRKEGKNEGKIYFASPIKAWTNRIYQPSCSLPHCHHSWLNY